MAVNMNKVKEQLVEGIYAMKPIETDEGMIEHPLVVELRDLEAEGSFISAERIVEMVARAEVLDKEDTVLPTMKALIAEVA